MDSTNPHLKSEMVDGQVILIPDAIAWQQLHEMPEIDGKPLGGTDYLRGQWELVERHPELCLGIYNTGRFLLPIVLLRMQNRWQRVHIAYPVVRLVGGAGQRHADAPRPVRGYTERAGVVRGRSAFGIGRLP